MNKQAFPLILTTLALLPALAMGLPRVNRPSVPKQKPIKHNVIYNGTPVSASGSSWRSVVRFVLGNSGCTGTLVGDRSILTAAHCVVGGGNSLSIELFHGSETSRYEFFEKGEFLVGRLDYDGNAYDRGERDMAVITVNKNLVDDEHRRMWFVTTSEIDAIQTGSPVYMIGGGTVGYSKDSQELRFAQGNISYYTNKMVWVQGRGNTGICAGDSGGPLTVLVNGEHLLLGVLAEYRTDIDNRSGDLCTPGGGYSFLSDKKYDWIQGKISAHEANLPLKAEPAPEPAVTPTPVPPTPTPIPSTTLPQ